MILAVRDKFHHWAQGPVAAASAAAAAVAGSLYLLDALSQACPRYQLTPAALSFAMMPQPGLSHDSFLISKIAGCLSCVEHISVYAVQQNMCHIIHWS